MGGGEVEAFPRVRTIVEDGLEKSLLVVCAVRISEALALLSWTAGLFLVLRQIWQIWETLYFFNMLLKMSIE
jgi:hypothetical protein